MALNIAINENYRITSDAHNVIVLRKHIVDPTKGPNWAKLEAKGADPMPREDWREQSYHGTVAQAIRAIGEQQVRDSEAESLAELLAEIKRVNSEIVAQLGFEGKR